MRIIRWMAAAFSLYSRIPMPHFTWREDDTAHSILFLPLIGAVIGGLVFWINIPARLPLGWGALPAAVRVLLTLLVPILVTGGFHLDGFMDTEDALRSYGSREKKLEILKDPHIGAFAVIGLIRVLLIFAAGVTSLLMDPHTDLRVLGIFSAVFVTARCLSGLTSLMMKKAKKDGMLYEETKGMSRGMLLFLAAELGASILFMLLLHPVRGGFACLAFAVYTAYYCGQMRRAFGGVTGDTAGYFLTSAEAAATAALAISSLLPYV